MNDGVISRSRTTDGLVDGASISRESMITRADVLKLKVRLHF